MNLFVDLCAACIHKVEQEVLYSCILSSLLPIPREIGIVNTTFMVNATLEVFKFNSRLCVCSRKPNNASTSFEETYFN